MFGFGSKRPIEDKMTEWLAHPSEFGVRPTSVQFMRTYRGKLVGHGKVEIHMVRYTMPDGTTGRGFVNGPLTWSFLGSDGADVNSISDDDLIVAYCGWAWIFPALQAGRVLTDFVSDGEHARLVAKKRSEGLTDIHVTSQYKIGTSELFEYSATMRGYPIRGAGDSNADVSFESNDPRFALPSIYFFLGEQVIESIR